MSKIIKTTLFFVAIIVGITTNAQTKKSLSYEDALIPNEVIVRLKKNFSPERVVSQMPAAYNFQIDQLLSPPLDIWLFKFDDSVVDVETVLDKLFELNEVSLAQVNTLLEYRGDVEIDLDKIPRATPDDPLYGNQWHHPKINSPGAWDITTGGTTATGDRIVVAIIESANVKNHPDLQANHWVNTAEIPGNGIDDDGNGYIDDYDGWNTITNNDNIGNGDHGTSCAGMVGAVGNNGVGVAGANWDVDIMVVAMGGLSQAGVIAAYSYPLALRKMWNDSNGAEGAFVVATNSSWGLNNANAANYPLWCEFYNEKGEAGILSFAATANNHVNVDVVGDMPTTCASEYMVAVTATTSTDAITFGGYGLTHIDVAAPGVNLYNTTQTGYSGGQNGTSYATPLTAGVAALMYSIPCESFMEIVKSNPIEAAEQVRDALFDGVDVTTHLQGLVRTGGRINSKNSIDILMERVCVQHDIDVGTTQIIEPVSGELTSAETIKIKIRNFGVNTQSNIPVYYNIDGGADVVETFTGTLASMEEAEYTFTTTANLGTAQAEYTINAGTNLSGDQGSFNNEKTKIVKNTTLSVMDNNLDNAELIVLTKENNHFEVILNTTSDIHESVYLKVYNVLSQNVVYKKLENDNGVYKTTLDMNANSSGIYFVRVGTLTNGTTQKIIVK